MKSLRTVDFVQLRWAWLFGHRSRLASRRLAIITLLLAASGLAASASVWLRMRGDLASRTVPQAMHPQVVADARAPSPPAVLGAAERLRVNRILRRLNTPWSAIFAALESQASPQVAVLSVEPDVERGAVRITTQGPSLDELLRHAARVQQAPQFAQVQLLRIEPEEASVHAHLSRLSFDLTLRQ